MVSIIIKIYTYLQRHRKVGILSFLALTSLLIGLVLKLNYKEDIMAFLPINSNHQDELRVYQDISGANKVFVLFQSSDGKALDPDKMVEAIDNYVSTLTKLDTNHVVTHRVMYQVDLDKMVRIMNFVYENIPYFLTQQDYSRMDSLLSKPNYVHQQLEETKQNLMFPGSAMFATSPFDPLHLFTPVLSRVQNRSSNLKGELYDGYMFTADMKRAIVIVDSPFGSSETEQNAKLIRLLQQAANKSLRSTPQITAHITGGPAIAVGNSQQIKKDSVLSISIAVVLIIVLLFLTLRSGKSLLLILFSVAWGGLFALGTLTLFHNEISVIVIGISSVIVGIAVNYPLHFIAHLEHTPNIRSALKEIVMPLVIGNITTVGAFLALVPLQAAALRDLGLFSAFLLMGTILFVLICLPHLVKPRKHETSNFLSNIGNFSFENKPIIVWLVVILTFIFGYYSLQTGFDTNMGHINYMTSEQKEDMSYFAKLMSEDTTTVSVYAMTTANNLDKALAQNSKAQLQLERFVDKGMAKSISSCAQFLTSKEEQKRRIQAWDNFVMKHRQQLTVGFLKEASQAGFNPDFFKGFIGLLQKHYTPQSLSYFEPLTSSIFTSNISIDEARGRYHIINQLNVKAADADRVIASLNASGADCHAFSVKTMNSTIANHLSNNFNYIGWACGFIVFFFLWFSFGSIELASLSFLPMAISWLWILGIMTLLGVQFNIVNVILATFIFGQGDDYTIFITEGSSYEYAYRKKVLTSYKNSIIISALIMFIGIGSLIFAKHPALHSLAEVTIIGMSSVVLMAYIFPPLIFNWLVYDRPHHPRVRPISLRYLVSSSYRKLDYQIDGAPAAYYHSFVLDRYRYKGVDVFNAVKHNLKRNKDYAAWIDEIKTGRETVLIKHNGYGEFALLFALSHKKTKVFAFEEDEDKWLLARYSAEDVAPNLQVLDAEMWGKYAEQYTDSQLFVLNPSAEERQNAKDFTIFVE